MKSYKNAILAALAESDGERAIAKYLKANPFLLIAALCPFGNHGNYILPEFGMGNELYADFVLIAGSSAGWEIEMIELEPVSDPVFNKDGTPSRRLRSAQKQIADWKEYQQKEEASLRRQLADKARESGPAGFPESHFDPCTMSNQRLRDIESFVRYSYSIVIGRRESLSERAQHLRSRATHQGDITIATYDRLVEAAERYGQRPK